MLLTWIAEGIRRRVRATDYPGAATFYVWHDVQAGQLRCSTGSVPPDRLPFGGAYVPVSDLGPVVGSFLKDGRAGAVAWDDLDLDLDVVPGPASGPLPVWVRSVGAAPV